MCYISLLLFTCIDYTIVIIHKSVDGENSKAELRETDIQLTTEVNKLEKQCKTAYQHIVELRNAYISSRRFIVFERYGALKAMIKGMLHSSFITMFKCQLVC